MLTSEFLGRLALALGRMKCKHRSALPRPREIRRVSAFYSYGRAILRGRFGPGKHGASAPSAPNRPRYPAGPLRPRETWRVSAFCSQPAALSCGAASAPGNMARQRLKRSRPLSRVLSWTVIPLAYASPRSSSDLPGSPCGPHVAAVKPLASLFGLAPGGVCRAVGVATRAVRSYRTISPLPAPLSRHLGGIFLLHFP